MCQTVKFESKNAVFCLPREQILGCRSLGLTFRQWKTDENPLIFYVGKTVKRCECDTADHTFCSWLPPCLYLPVNNYGVQFDVQKLNILILKFMFVIVALWFLRQQRQQEQRSDCELYVVSWQQQKQLLPAWRLVATWPNFYVCRAESAKA